MTDFSHLNALQANLSREEKRLALAVSEGERALRTVWVAQLQREVAAEYEFLGITPCDDDMSDDELLAALQA